MYLDGSIYPAAWFMLYIIWISIIDIIFLGIGTNIAAGIGRWIFSFIENKYGSKNIIVLSLCCIFIISLIIIFLNQKNLFIIFAILLSSFFGPILSASRVYYLKSILKATEILSPSEKVTAFIGPVLYGTITYIFSSPKIGMASLLILFFIGLLILTKVKNDFNQTWLNH